MNDNFPFEIPEKVAWASEFILPFNRIQLVQGVYLLGKESKVIYIGSSANILARIGSHLKDKWFDSVHYACTNNWTKDYMEQFEFYLICAFQPSINKKLDKYEKYADLFRAGHSIIKDLKWSMPDGNSIPLESPYLPVISKHLEQKVVADIENTLKPELDKEKRKINAKYRDAEVAYSRAKKNEVSTMGKFLNKKIVSLVNENSILSKTVSKLEAQASDTFGLVA
jgi:hypothetical protein